MKLGLVPGLMEPPGGPWCLCMLRVFSERCGDDALLKIPVNRKRPARGGIFTLRGEQGSSPINLIKYTN